MQHPKVCRKVILGYLILHPSSTVTAIERGLGYARWQHSQVSVVLYQLIKRGLITRKSSPYTYKVA
jgi:DNA-binding MarR family transcriptional regulator